MPTQYSMRTYSQDVQGLGYTSQQVDQLYPINIQKNSCVCPLRQLVTIILRIYLDPCDIANLCHLKTCYPLHEYLYQRFMSELHCHLIPLLEELRTLTYLLPYHIDQSKLGNHLTALAISMENAEILFSR